MKLFCLIPSLLALSACSSIIEGTTQKISVYTSPPGASCDLSRKGDTIASIQSTPGTVTIDKTKDDIDIECQKSGFSSASFHNKSDVAGATFGNMIAGGLIGWAVDSADGADNKYSGSVHLTLDAVAAQPAMAPMAASPTAPAPAPDKPPAHQPAEIPAMP